MGRNDDDRSEHRVQSKLVSETDHLMKRHLIRLAIPNGGMRHPIVGKRLKEEGLIPGSPDLVFLLEHGLTFWLEMKRLRDGRRTGLEDVQVGLHAKMRRLGHTVEVAGSVEEALEILYRHGGILR